MSRRLRELARQEAREKALERLQARELAWEEARAEKLRRQREDRGRKPEPPPQPQGPTLRPCSPRTESQRRLWSLWPSSEVLFVLGSAGTGKTFCISYLAAQELLSGQKKELVLLRPAVSAGEELGYLPGDLSEKLRPWLAPFYGCLREIGAKGLKIREESLGLIRGATFSNCVAILTEAQNATEAQIKLFLSRLGPNARLILEGDPAQSDLPPGRSYLARAAALTEGLEAVGVAHLSGSVRHPLIDQILARLCPSPPSSLRTTNCATATPPPG